MIAAPRASEVSFARFVLGYAALQSIFVLSRWQLLLLPPVMNRKLLVASVVRHHAQTKRLLRDKHCSRMEIAASFGSQLVGLLAADAFATWQEL